MMEGIFQDKKTYILSAAGVAATVLFALRFISLEVWQIMMGIIVSLAAATLKKGQKVQIDKLTAQVETVKAYVAAVPEKVVEQVIDQAAVVAKTLAVKEEAHDKKVLDAVEDLEVKPEQGCEGRNSRRDTQTANGGFPK